MSADAPGPEPELSPGPAGGTATSGGPCLPLTGHVAAGAAAILSTTWVRFLLRIGVTAIVARILVPADFGLVAAAMVVIGFTDLVAELGVCRALVQLPKVTDVHVRVAFTVSLFFAVVLASACLLGAPALAALFGMPPLVPILRVMAFLLVLRALAAVSLHLLQREMRYGLLARNDLVTYVLGYAIPGVGLALLGAGVWALVAATYAQLALQSILYYVESRHPLRPSLDRAAFRDLASFGAWSTATSLLSFAARRGDNVVVGRYLGATALGFYGQAYHMMDLSNSLLTNALGTVLYPAYAHVQSDRERLKRAYRRSMGWVMTAMLPVSAVAVVLADEIVLVFLGSQWRPAILPFRILAAGMFLRTGYKVGGTLLTGTGEVRTAAGNQFAYAASVVGGALLAWRWGVTGVALTTLLALALMFVLLTRAAMRRTSLGLGELLRDLRPAGLLSVSCATVSLAAAVALRSVGAPAPVVLAVGGGAAAGAAAAVIRHAPRRWVGDLESELRNVLSVLGRKVRRSQAGRTHFETEPNPSDGRAVEPPGSAPARR